MFVCLFPVPRITNAYIQLRRIANPTQRGSPAIVDIDEVYIFPVCYFVPSEIIRTFVAELKEMSYDNTLVMLVSDDAEVTLLTIYDKGEISNVSDSYIQALIRNL